MPDDSRAIVTASHADWLEERRKSVGASEVAAILGADPWHTPLEVYSRKVMPDPPTDEQTEAQELGHEFEPMIAKVIARRLGVEVEAPDPFTIYRRDGTEFMHATPDFFIMDKKRAGHGLLECKSSARRVDDWEDGTPLYTQIQIQAQFWCEGSEWGYAAALTAVKGFAIRPFPAEADARFQEAMVEKVAAFWKRVVSRDPPPPSGAADYDTVRRMFKRASKKTILLPATTAPTYDLWLASKAARLASEKHEKAMAAQIMAQIGDAEVGVLPDGRRVKWATEERHEAAREARTTTVRKLIPLNKERAINGNGDSGTKALAVGDDGGQV